MVYLWETIFTTHSVIQLIQKKIVRSSEVSTYHVLHAKAFRGEGDSQGFCFYEADILVLDSLEHN